jgi:hypothetical protein
MAGFRSAYLAPLFFFLGMVCELVLVGWLLPASYYFVRTRLRVNVYGYYMLVGSLLAALSGWFLLTNYREDKVTAIRCTHDTNLATYDEWARQVKFPYVASPDKIRRVRDNYSIVGIGSSKDDVIRAFGTPDYEREYNSKAINSRCVGYGFHYYFEKPEDMANEIHDKVVDVYFSPEGKATWIVGNVGLPEEGSPRRP